MSGQTLKDLGLQDLAKAAGLAIAWTDYRGQPRTVSDESLRVILAAMDLPADTKGELSHSLETLAVAQRTRPALVTAVRGQYVRLAGKPAKAVLTLETGERLDLAMKQAAGGASAFRAPMRVGYHRLETDEGATTLAVAPARALDIADLTGARQAWGVAAQLYSLNYGGDFGDFGDLAGFATALGQRGADAVAVSPTHALFTADLGRYAPYGPSTRLFLNPLYAPTGPHDGAKPPPLIDWPGGAERKMQALRDDYAAFCVSRHDRAVFEDFVQAGGAPLLSHARFEVLDGRFRPRGLYHWRNWPDGFADAQSKAVQMLAMKDPEVEFQLFLQWRVDQAAGAAQGAAKEAGMAVGLISDLAVGMDGAGSHAWSRPMDVLTGVSIGAPPDLLAHDGQTWGLTTFSPTALRAQGYEPFLATLRAALRHAGGVRIDHAIGLEHLWVTPEGAKASEGAYLDYPFEDLLRLLALESHRRRAIVIGEDLGTVPPGFRARTTAAGLAGMRVLWFEQTKAGDFRAPSRWGRRAAAMTTTHDLPAVAGWWRGRDIDWREQIGADADPAASRRDRARDAGRLWRAMLKSGAAQGRQPGPNQTDKVVDAALAHVAGADCDLALIAMEDVLGEVEQPNLPGLSDPHPNWRRRLPPGNGLDQPEAVARLKALNRARGRKP